jgi:hypothetical protein
MKTGWEQAFRPFQFRESTHLNRVEQAFRPAVRLVKQLALAAEVLDQGWT